MGFLLRGFVLSFLFVSISFLSYSDWYQIAFIQKVQANGEVLELENEGRFSHIAIKYGNRWLHTHPYLGVVLAEDVSEMGKIVEILMVEAFVRVSIEQFIEEHLGKKYDLEFNWAENERLYCSELVGKFLGLEPRPMDFSTMFWQKYEEKRGVKLPSGAPGLSPDGIHSMISKEHLLEHVHLPIQNKCGLLF